MMVSEKRLCPSAKISHTVSCNISLYRDTKEMIYRYTQNVYRCISNVGQYNSFHNKHYWVHQQSSSILINHVPKGSCFKYPHRIYQGRKGIKNGNYVTH